MKHWFEAVLAVSACTFWAPPDVQARPLVAACGALAPFDEPIARASARFAIPATLVRAVIAVESGGAVFAVSPMGAMGLMQLMPGTWGTLRQRHSLGADPFDPCDNIYAGTAYLREMLDRYGDPGFLAAYNAGPGRYEAYLSGARPLPAETIAYVARVSARSGRGFDAPAPRAVPDPDAWRGGALFVGAPKIEAEASPQRPEKLPADSAPEARTGDPEIARETVFVPRTKVPE